MSLTENKSLTQDMSFTKHGNKCRLYKLCRRWAVRCSKQILRYWAVTYARCYLTSTSHLQRMSHLYRTSHSQRKSFNQNVIYTWKSFTENKSFIQDNSITVEVIYARCHLSSTCKLQLKSFIQSLGLTLTM